MFIHIRFIVIAMFIHIRFIVIAMFIHIRFIVIYLKEIIMDKSSLIHYEILALNAVEFPASMPVLRTGKFNV